MRLLLSLLLLLALSAGAQIPTSVTRAPHVATGVANVVADAGWANAFPTLTYSPTSNALVATYYANPYYHSSLKQYKQTAGGIWQRVSWNDGVTWGDATRVMPQGLEEYRDGGILKLSNGRYLFNCNQDYIVTSTTRTTGVYYVWGDWSDVHGRILWSDPITLKAADASYNYSSCGNGAELDDGSIVLGYYRYLRQYGAVDTNCFPFAAVSTNSGATWSHVQISSTLGNEAMMESLGGSNVRAWVRAQALRYYDSSDGGFTWGSGTSFTPANWNDCKPMLVRLPSGEYFMVYRNNDAGVRTTKYVVSTGGRASWGTPVDVFDGYFLYSGIVPTATGCHVVYSHTESTNWDSTAISPSKIEHFEFTE